MGTWRGEGRGAGRVPFLFRGDSLKSGGSGRFRLRLSLGNPLVFFGAGPPGAAPLDILSPASRVVRQKFVAAGTVPHPTRAAQARSFDNGLGGCVGAKILRYLGRTRIDRRSALVGDAEGRCILI